MVPFYCKLGNLILFESKSSFKIGNRCFIVMDTQVYVLADEEALRMREKQSDWLIKTFASLPTGMKTTIFTHTPLFIESVDESKAVEGKM